MNKVVFALFFLLGLALLAMTIIVERQLVAAGIVP